MAKRKNQDDIRTRKTALFIERTSSELNLDSNVVANLFTSSLKQSVRINPLAGKPAETLEAMIKMGWSGEPVAWCANGYSITEGFEALRDSELVLSGKVYIQNRSSWIPVIALQPQPHDAILDVCAAPGGKTSHLAALMQNTGLLIANDNSRPRLMKLQANMERLGTRAEYTLHDATKLARHFDSQQFDKILLDAPCSGEGLIDLSRSSTLDSWSVAHIRRLATLQKQLILQAFQLLKPGGRLVYSTCTLAPEEDEIVIDWLVRREQSAKLMPFYFNPEGSTAPVHKWNGKQLNPDIRYTKRIIPESGGEAFFTAILEKHIE